MTVLLSFGEKTDDARACAQSGHCPFKLGYLFLTHSKSWPCKSLQMWGTANAFSVVLKSVPDLVKESSTRLTASSSWFWSPNVEIFSLSVLTVFSFKAGWYRIAELQYQKLHVQWDHERVPSPGLRYLLEQFVRKHASQNQYAVQVRLLPQRNYNQLATAQAIETPPLFLQNFSSFINICYNWHSDARWFPLQNKQFNSPRFPPNNALAVDSLPGLNESLMGIFSPQIYSYHTFHGPPLHFWQFLLQKLAPSYPYVSPAANYQSQSFRQLLHEFRNQKSSILCRIDSHSL